MAKSIFKCTNCNETFPKWEGQCKSCKQWNTLEEAVNISIPKKADSRAAKVASNNVPTPISKISADEYERFSTGMPEFDRVLGGGLVPGGVVLIAGSPGVGKSSLTLAAAYKLAVTGKKVLLVSGEETAGQIASRARRINALNDNLFLLSEANLSNVSGHIQNLKPDVIIIDSIQTLLSEDSEGRVGSVGQVSEVASTITNLAKTMNIPAILIGHVTKDGNIAGPRVVEHLVDAVLYFEDNSDTPLRMLRAIKNRYGATDEIGCFEHTSEGLIEVADPSGILLSEHEDGTVGYVTSILIEGNRALPIEITALVTPTPLPNPRKISHGLDNARVLMIQAILEKYAGIRLNNKDVYVSTTGGIIAKDTNIDLAIAAAIVSSYKGVAVPPEAVFLGETALTGEIRPPRELKKRIAEAERLGFNKVYYPKSATFNVANIKYLNQIITD